MVKNTKAKGQRIERKAEDFLRDRGYLTQRQNNHRFGDNDYFNYWDVLAIPVEDIIYISDYNIFGRNRTNPILAQVKANTASGIQDTGRWIEEHGLDEKPVRFLYMVWHDREGWRILEHCVSDGWVTIIDQR